jgi:hypothetical protein
MFQKDFFLNGKVQIKKIVDASYACTHETKLELTMFCQNALLIFEHELQMKPNLVQIKPSLNYWRSLEK